MTTKPSNPKDAIGSDKLPLHLWPATATAMGSVGLLNGMLKYGRSNWRHAGVRASIYRDAAGRHLDRWFEGEDVDPDDGVPHLAAALACLAIIVDAQAAGKLTDDRQTPGGLARVVDELTPHVARLKKLHGERAPRHYTIADAPVPEADTALLDILDARPPGVLFRSGDAVRCLRDVDTGAGFARRTILKGSEHAVYGLQPSLEGLQVRFTDIPGWWPAAAFAPVSP